MASSHYARSWTLTLQLVMAAAIIALATAQTRVMVRVDFTNSSSSAKVADLNETAILALLSLSIEPESRNFSTQPEFVVRKMDAPNNTADFYLSAPSYFYSARTLQKALLANSTIAYLTSQNFSIVKTSLVQEDIPPEPAAPVDTSEEDRMAVQGYILLVLCGIATIATFLVMRNKTLDDF